MPDLSLDLLPLLVFHRLDGLDAGPGAVYPWYEGYSLANLPASVCAWLGVPGFGSRPLADKILGLWQRPFQNVIFLVVDGMGLNMVEAAARLSREEKQAGRASDLAVWQNLFDEAAGPDGAAALAPLTSMAPSTTSTVLTTFWTGRPPAEHGVVGYEMWLKEYSLIANMILHAPASYAADPGSLRRAGFSPETFLPVPVLGPHLARHGVHPYALQHHAIARSGLSTMLFQGVGVLPFRSLSDLWVTLEDLLKRRAEERKYLYIYWGDLDEHSHLFGPEDERVALELAHFSRQLERFIHRQEVLARGDTLLIITADHGHISTPPRPEYELRNQLELSRCQVMSPSGEARMPFAYLRPGFEQRFLDLMETTWPGEFRAVPSAQVVESGLFGAGTAYERLLDRVGDYVIFPQGNAYWWFGARDNLLRGRHGGLSRTEMLVPLIMKVL